MKFFSLVFLLLTFRSYCSTDFDKKFTGNIGNKYPIEITLIKKGKNLQGTYNYKKSFGDLKLEGTISDLNQFFLNEINSKGVVCGHFIGKLIESHLVGTWKKPDGVRSYTFIATDISNESVEVAMQDDSVKIYNLIYEWSEAHNTKDISRFEKILANELLFYSLSLEQPEVIKKKLSFFDKNESFKQFIYSPIYINEYSNGTIKCNFVKTVVLNGKSTDYPSYLLLIKEGKDYVITGESDLISDKNLGYKLEIGNVVKGNGNFGMLFYFAISIFLVLCIFLYIRYKSRLDKNKRTNSDLTQTNKTENLSIKEVAKDSNLDVKELNKIINKFKGDEFEEYVVGSFDKKYFKLLDWRSDKGVQGVFPESNEYPDLEFQFQHNNYVKRFAIECKFRKESDKDLIEFAYPDQLTRYRNYSNDKGIEVYLVIGFGGIPISPKELFLIPLNEIESPKISINVAREKYFKQIGRNFYYSTVTHRLT